MACRSPRAIAVGCCPGVHVLVRTYAQFLARRHKLLHISGSIRGLPALQVGIEGVEGVVAWGAVRVKICGHPGQRLLASLPHPLRKRLASGGALAQLGYERLHRGGGGGGGGGGGRAGALHTLRQGL